MTKLNSRSRVLLLDELDQAFQRLDENIVPDAEVAQRAAAPPLDLGRLDHNEARATSRELSGIHQMPVRRKPLYRGVLMHRRHDYAIAQLNASDRQRRKQQHFGHGRFPRSASDRAWAAIPPVHSTIYALGSTGQVAIPNSEHQPRCAVPCRKAPDTIPERQRLSSPRTREDTMNEATRIPPAAVELGAGGEEFQNLHELIRKARANLNQNTWDYIVGAAETETTLRRNRMSLDEIAFRPRVLRDVSQVDTSVERFGRKLRLPVMIAPVGALEIFDPEGAAAVARGAGRFGAAHMLSSVSEPGLEATAKTAPDALRIYQLYVRGGGAFVEDCVSRSIDNGYAAFCLTVDTAHYSRRERDIAKRYVRESRIRATGGDFQKGLDWRTVKLIKDKYKIPLVIKGIATAEDAAIALDHGVDWIYVSNHGGRQLDHGRGAMHVLPEIVDAVAGRARIMVDGSFCRGTDIVKA